MDKDVRDEFKKQGSHSLALEQLLFALISEKQRSHLLAEAALLKGATLDGLVQASY